MSAMVDKAEDGGKIYSYKQSNLYYLIILCKYLIIFI